MWQSYQERLPHFHCTCGLRSYHKQTDNYCYYGDQISIQKYGHTSTSTGTMTTMHTHLCSSAWNVLSMKSQENDFSPLNTANERMSSAHRPNIIGHGMFGWRKRGHSGCQKQFVSNTNISKTHQPRQPTPSLRRSTMSRRHCKEKCQHRSMNPPSKPSNACRKYLVR